MDAPSLSAAVRRELLAHPGVTEADHRFGGVVFHAGGHEIGHLHGERIADLPLPPHIRDELLASGRLSPHHLVPDSTWVSWRVNGPADVGEIVALFRISYEHAASQPPASSAEENRETPPGVDPQRNAAWRNLLALRPRPLLGRRGRRE